MLLINTQKMATNTQYKIKRWDNVNLLFTPKSIPIIEGLKDNQYVYDQYKQFKNKSECNIYGKNIAYYNKNDKEILLIIEDRQTLPTEIFGYNFTERFANEYQCVVTRWYAYYKIIN